MTQTTLHAHILQGKASRDIPTLLGYEGSEEIVHRNKICLVALPVGGDPHDGEHDGEHDGGDDGQGGLMEGVAGGRGAAVVDDVHSTKYQQHHHQKHEKQVRTMIEGPAGGMGDDDVAERLAVLRYVVRVQPIGGGCCRGAFVCSVHAWLQG